MTYSLDHVKSMHIGTVRDREILACMNELYPSLQAILDQELGAGNAVMDASRDWPDEGSIFITLKESFHRKYDADEGVEYSEPNDPHYWHADYSCGEPIHVLAF